MPVTMLDPATALVLVDLQRGITAIAPPGIVHPVARVAGRLATGFRSRGLPVILVRMTFSPDGRDAPRNRVTAAPAVGPLPDRWTELLDEVGRRPGDLVVEKHQPGAFHGTDLELQLRRRGVTGIVLGGLLTSHAVETTGRVAYDLGFNVTFASDAMADLDPTVHAHSVERVFPRFGEVGDAASILALLPRVADAA